MDAICQGCKKSLDKLYLYIHYSESSSFIVSMDCNGNQQREEMNAEDSHSDVKYVCPECSHFIADNEADANAFLNCDGWYENEKGEMVKE